MHIVTTAHAGLLLIAPRISYELDFLVIAMISLDGSGTAVASVKLDCSLLALFFNNYRLVKSKEPMTPHVHLLRRYLVIFIRSP